MSIRVFLISLIMLLLSLVSMSCAQSGELRQSQNFNRQWSFQLGDFPGAQAVDFDDKSWELANIPHSFSMPYFAMDKFYVGYGWYRKSFEMPSELGKKRVSLEFDGVFQVAEVFVNGIRIGEHKGGYTGFTMDITSSVKAGNNVLAIRVNNNWDARLAPRAGEHVFSGGIYRNVRMVITAPVHVAWYGTCVTTPQVSKESAKVNVKTEVVNESGMEKTVTVVTAIIDADGKTVAQMQSTKTVATDKIEIFDQTSQAIANPRLWSPAQPNMYSVKTVVQDGATPVDDYISPLGFRWFKFTADEGFFLNGEHYYFKGANVHQDHAGWGDAVVDNGFMRDVKLVKDAGFDFIRGSHYPHAPAFSAACDKLGMLFLSENCFWGTGGFGNRYWVTSAYPTDPADEPDFQTSVKASLRDMIRIHRNHPSIISWSMGNEVFFSDGKVMPKARTFLAELAAYSRQLDPTRPVTMGGVQRGEMDKLGDIAGYNGDGARLFADPGIPSIVTEYGSTMADRPGKYEPGWGDLPATPGADRNVAYSWRLPWRSGEVIWCAFDHGSLAGRRFGGMGLVDYFRLPKRQWYWYRNEYLNIAPPAWPVEGTPAALKLTADKMVLESVDGTDDTQLIVAILDKDGKALSNCPSVTLTIESGPGEFPTGTSITFAPDSDIAIRDGLAAIELRSYYAGTTVIRATSAGLQDAVIEIVSKGDLQYQPGITLPVKARPYTGNIPDVNQNRQQATLKFGLENPTRASSEAQQHTGRMANDNNLATFWQPTETDNDTWLVIDLERIVVLSSVKLTFNSDGSRHYRLEMSMDGNSDWKVISDQTGSINSDKQRILSDLTKATGRFLRISFVKSPGDEPVAVAELEATGKLANQ